MMKLEIFSIIKQDTIKKIKITNTDPKKLVLIKHIYNNIYFIYLKVSITTLCYMSNFIMFMFMLCERGDYKKKFNQYHTTKSISHNYLTWNFIRIKYVEVF